MTLRKLGCAAAALVLAVLPLRAADYAVKVVPNTPAPKELDESVRKLMGDQCVQLLDGKGEVRSQLWFRKDVPVKATEAQVKNGLTYAEVPETTLLGAMRVVKGESDYRKQKVPPGVYTLRLAIQLMDGDHMGTAPYNQFLLASPADEDKKPGTMEAKALHEMSAKTTNNHPAVFLLFPGDKTATTPKLVTKPGGHWVLMYLQEMKAGDKKATLPVGLTLVGASSAA